MKTTAIYISSIWFVSTFVFWHFSNGINSDDLYPKVAYEVVTLGILTKVLPCIHLSLSKHRGDGIVKLGRGPYIISSAILSMSAGFHHPGTMYMMTFLCGYSCGFSKWSI